MASIANPPTHLSIDQPNPTTYQYLQDHQPLHGPSEIPQQLPLEVKEYEENTETKPRDASPSLFIPDNDALSNRLQSLIGQSSDRIHFKEPRVALYILFHAWRSFIK